MKKIIFTQDFLYHSPSFKDTYHWFVFDLFSPLIKLATGQELIELQKLKNKKGETFSRDRFYELSGIYNITEAYYAYDINRIGQESIKYLKTFLGNDTVIVGIELGKECQKMLTDIGCSFLGLWFHSWKLFDDSFFMMTTNNNDIYKTLKKYQVPKEQFEFYAKYWKIWQQQKLGGVQDAHIEDNSAVFIGQTLRDKSTDKDGKYLNVLDFKEYMAKLSEKYSHIYYAPHPYVTFNQDIENYIAQTPYLSKTTVPTYQLLMSDKVKKVVSISSSVLYEAEFFGKNIEYLYQPLFNIDGRFEDNTYISIYQSYFNPKFWSDIFAPFMTVSKQVLDKSFFFEGENKFRNIKALYYGYQSFNEHKILQSEMLCNVNNLKKNN